MHRPLDHALCRYFEGLVQYAIFERLGVVDVPLADYLTDLPCRFMHMDASFCIRHLHDRRFEEVAEMLTEAPESNISGRMSGQNSFTTSSTNQEEPYH